MTDELVTNASNPRDVERAKRKTKDRARRFGDELRAALAVPACRRVLWRLMYEARTGFSHCLEVQPHMTASVWDASGQRLAYNAGRQDLGHLVQSWIRQADPRALLKMADEQLALEERDRRDNEAARIAAAAKDAN